MSRILTAVQGAAIAAALVAPLAPRVHADLPPLISRDVLFSEPSRGRPVLSPDGTRLSYLARGEGAHAALWVRTLDTQDSVRLTDGSRPVHRVFWTSDGLAILFLSDQQGDENQHLFSVSPKGGVVRDLTPFVGCRVEQVILHPAHPKTVLVALNPEDPRRFDLYRIDLRTGAITLDTRNPGDVSEWLCDGELAPRAVAALDPKTGDTILRVRDSATGPWRELQRWPFEEAGNDRYQRLIGFTNDGLGMIVQTPIGANTTRIVTLDASSGRELAVHAVDTRADVHNVLLGTTGLAMVMRHPRSGEVQAVSFNYMKPEWRVVDRSLAADFQRIARIAPGVFFIASRDREDRRWVVHFERPDAPDRYYLYERSTRTAELLFDTHPEISQLPLAAMEPRTFRARDGATIPCYLTLPPGVPARRLPMVLSVHGGPWWRDEWSYQPDVQWLANRGYAVLQVNFRGSTGFGKKYLNAGDGGFGVGTMQNDLTDAVLWAVRAGIADPKRVAIMGGSFGGYAALCGMTFTPELYACGVDMVGPSNLRTLIESFPPYWEVRKRRWLRRMGDVLADEELNRRISPLFHVDRIRAPLLIAHGANDPRVKLAESEQIVQAMRGKGLPVTFVVYRDEGHGLQREENMRDFSARIEEFLAQHLGGRAAGPTGESPASSADVR